MRCLMTVCPGLLFMVASTTLPAQTIVLPAGTQIPLVVTLPIWSGSVKVGDSIYTQTTFPATSANQMAVPSGTYVEGAIDALTKPSRTSNHASISIHFTKIIFANGYTVLLPGPTTASGRAAGAILDVQASTANDLLLDNGAQIEMTIGTSLTLDSAQVSAAMPLSKPVQPGTLKSATLCRASAGAPGSLGSADTVIPGSPGTPATVIPGANGLPDTVIPGLPATPATVIPGSPGTLDTYCPAPPLVLSSSATPQPFAPPVPAKHR